MKKFVLFALFALTGCIDVIHYVSFNDKEQTVVSVQTSIPSAMFDSGGRDEEEIKTKISGLTLAGVITDPNIKTSNIIFSNSASYGVQARYTAPKDYLAKKAQDFFPVKEPYGFSLAAGDALRKAVFFGEINDMEIDDMENEAAAVMIKYRILLSKASLTRPLVKAVLSSPEGSPVEAPITDYGVMYMIEIPFGLILKEGVQKVEFHFAQK